MEEKQQSLMTFSDGHEEPVDQAIAWAKTVTQPSQVPEKAVPVRTERSGYALWLAQHDEYVICAASECPVHHGGNAPYCPEQPGAATKAP